MNSPLSSRSGTTKVTSRMAVNSFGPPGIVRLGHIAELDDVRRRGLVGVWTWSSTRPMPTARPALRGWLGVGGFGRMGSWALARSGSMDSPRGRGHAASGQREAQAARPAPSGLPSRADAANQARAARHCRRSGKGKALSGSTVTRSRSRGPRGDDQQHAGHVLARSSPLRGVDDVAQPARFAAELDRPRPA